MLIVKMVVSEEGLDLKTAAAAGVAFGLGLFAKIRRSGSASFSRSQ
jgi:hypothetical protein